MTVKDSETGNKVSMDLEKDNTVDEVIEAAVDHWRKDPKGYVLRVGKKQVNGEILLGDLNPLPGDILELLPDPSGA